MGARPHPRRTLVVATVFPGGSFLTGTAVCSWLGCCQGAGACMVAAVFLVARPASWMLTECRTVPVGTLSYRGSLPPCESPRARWPSLPSGGYDGGDHTLGL